MLLARGDGIREEAEEVAHQEEKEYAAPMGSPLPPLPPTPTPSPPQSPPLSTPAADSEGSPVISPRDAQLQTDSERSGLRGQGLELSVSALQMEDDDVEYDASPSLTESDDDDVAMGAKHLVIGESSGP